MKLNELKVLLARLEIPAEFSSLIGVWPGRAEGSLEVHLTPTAFWKVVKRVGGGVKTEERNDLLFSYRHRLIVEGVEFFTFSAEPVLPPGTVTPGYALRLT